MSVVAYVCVSACLCQSCVSVRLRLCFLGLRSHHSDFNVDKKRLWVMHSYRETLQVTNRLDKPVTVNVTPLVNDVRDASDSFSFSVGPRVLKLAAGEVRRVTMYNLSRRQTDSSLFRAL